MAKGRHSLPSGNVSPSPSLPENSRVAWTRQSAFPKPDQVMLSEMEDEVCLECLQRRIQIDLSGNLTFLYGISRSALPFGSRAVVQLSNSINDVSARFRLVYIRSSEYDCLTKYADEYTQENLEGNNNCGNTNMESAELNEDKEEVSVEFLSYGTASSDSLSNTSQCLLNGGRKISLAGLGPEKSYPCYYSSRFSCSRTITALAPDAHVGLSSYSTFEDLTSAFLSGFLEDCILGSLSLLIEGKAASRDSINFLNLIGIPSFDDDSFPGCIRHPNLAPVLGILKAHSSVSLVLPELPHTLENILHYSPNALKSEWHIKLLMYQLLSALHYLHGLGVSHGNLRPSSVMLTNLNWSWLCISDKPCLKSKICSRNAERVVCCTQDCPSQGLYADLKLSTSTDWPSSFLQWWRGEMSNFEYLLNLNRLAGRRWGDHTFHTVMPWVIDFSMKPDENSDSGWRDLSKSKWRLAKGDEQLDFTYATSEIPHHVSDECLSELAVCSYKARRLPLSILRMAVRSVYEPNEYPSNMQRLYQWTPDECIPEFYCDPRIFYSLHSGMTDLSVPSWASGPEDFIKLHRNALESDRVSAQIHHWIDIMFGFKMSGQAAIVAKNVMLPSSEPTRPRSMGRRQLFTRPHPIRRLGVSKTNKSELEELEEAASFCEHAQHLSPLYHYHAENISDAPSFFVTPSEKTIHESLDRSRNYGVRSVVNGDYLLDYLEMDDDNDCTGYQELLLWKQNSSCLSNFSVDVSKDIFSVGCILAELYLRRPLFNPSSLALYLENGILPPLMQQLPPHASAIVEACILKDWKWRPSAKSLLESPYFPKTVKSAYLFLAPLQLLAKDESRLHYAAIFAKRGAFKAMGTFAAEMCAPYCLPLVLNPLSATESEWAYILLQEILKSLRPKALKTIILPTIQKILQATSYSHLKVSLLQDSFVREVRNQIGKQAYLETIHPLVICNLYISPHKCSAAAASVLLIGSSEELGVPVTMNQTILPLIHCFGKGLCADGIDVLVRIGGLFGENFVVRQILPLLKNVVRSCVEVSNVNKPEPMQSWSSLALIDCLMTLDSISAILPKEVVVRELIEDRRSLHVMVLMQHNLEIPVLQTASTTLTAICQRIGPDLTALHVLPQLKELFDELAFSRETSSEFSSLGKSMKLCKPEVVEHDTQIESRLDLVLLLYPAFASLLGIEKLRQCCSTWLLLEQFLLRSHNWKWEHAGESPRSEAENLNYKRPMVKSSTSEYNPAKLLLNGVGWSIPQSQGTKGTKNLILQKNSNDIHQNPIGSNTSTASNFGKRDPWFWFPSPAASWNGPDFLIRVGGPKDELQWKIRASIVHSVRAHHGALRSLAVCQDECTVFTGGVGPGFKGTVQKWELSRTDCVSGYYGHEEVVNGICVLPNSGKVASCDGTIHVWNGQTGKIVSTFAETSATTVNAASPLSSASSSRVINIDHNNMVNSNSLTGGIMTSAFDGSLYTSMHLQEQAEKLVAGTGNGCVRFIDIIQGQKLHLWRTESVESTFPSLVSAMCSCGAGEMRSQVAATSASWIAVGLSSGHCRMIDARIGNIIASWKAHDGYVTKLAAPEDNLLVSSSLDRTLKVWDLRRNWSSQPTVFRGHKDGISDFAVWGQDVISISRNNIGLSSLTRSTEEDGRRRISPQKLYIADRGTKNMSVLSSISILPFSRLFLVGTEDGDLKICC